MADIYVSEKGSGSKTGAGFDNAMAFASLNAAIKAAGPGGRVYLLADTAPYQITAPVNIYAGGAEGAAVTISGLAYDGSARDVVIGGTRAPTYTANMAGGNELFRILGGGHLVFENMKIENTGTVFRVGADYQDLTIRDIDAVNVKRFFEDYASGSNKTATISGLRIEDVTVQGFSKGVIRLQYDSHDIVIDNVWGDSQRQDGDDFAIGVHLEGTVHDVRITNSLMENISDTVGDSYWNGDGFASEGDTYNITFENVISRGNTDSGFDLKSANTVMINTIAEDNKRNYRFWGDAQLFDIQALDPHSRGGTGSQAQIQVSKGGSIVVNGGVIKDAGSRTYVFDNDGKIELHDTAITRAVDAKTYSGKAVQINEMQVVASEGRFSTSYEASTKGFEAVANPATAPTSSAAAPLPPQVSQAPDPVVVKRSTPIPLWRAGVLDSAAGDAAGAPTAPVPVPAPAPANHFVVSATGPAKQALPSFAVDSVLLVKDALPDGNADGLIGLGSERAITLAAGQVVSLPAIKELRYMGETAAGHAYASSAGRPKNVIEGRVSNDVHLGDAAGAKAERFFFDNALRLDLGDDTVRNFDAQDVIITTTQLELGSDGRVHAGADGFALHDAPTGLDDHVQVFAVGGAEVEALQLLRASPSGDVTWYVYGGVFESGMP